MFFYNLTIFHFQDTYKLEVYKMTQQNQQAEMTPEQALGVLEKVTATYQGNRNDHNLIAVSINVLNYVIADWRKILADLASQQQAKTTEQTADNPQ